MSDDFKRARLARSQLRTCDCCHSTATNKQVRAKLKRNDLAEWEQIADKAFNSPEYKEAAAKVPASFTF